MNSFDAAIILFLNKFAQRLHVFDSSMALIARNNLLKGGIVVAMLWWAWFKIGKDELKRRNLILTTLLSCFIVLFSTRILALTLPFRLRPMHNLELAIQLPYTIKASILKGWSSFPSDHASLFFALSTGIFFMSRFMGTIAIMYTFLIICVPRIYLGFHYPTDIIGGALIGIGITCTVNTNIKIRKFVDHIYTVRAQNNPGIFYAILFILTYQFATLFDDTREIGRFVFLIIKSVLNHIQI